MKKSASLTALFFALTLVIASSAFSQDTIKIGAIYDFAGACHMYSEVGVKGIKIAVEEINAKGGILGKKVEYIVRDTEAKVDVAVREVKDLILREKVNFLIGPCSSGTGLAMQVVHSEYKILRIAPIANTEAQTVDKFSRYFVQVVPNTYMEAVAATRYLNKKVPKAKKFCTIGPDYEFGRREETAFAEEIKKLVPDAEIVYEAWPKLGEKHFTAFITAIMAKKPDAVHGSLFGGLAWAAGGCAPVKDLHFEPAGTADPMPRPAQMMIEATSTSPLTEMIPTLTPIPLLVAPTATSTVSPEPTFEFCSPLQGYSLEQIADAVTNPFNPPRPGSDDPHQGVDLADRLPGSQTAVQGRAVQAVLAGKVAAIILDRFPYGNALMVETPVEHLPPGRLDLAALPTSTGPVIPDLQNGNTNTL